MGLNPSALPARSPAWGGLFELGMSIAGAWLSTHAWTGSATPPDVPAPRGAAVQVVEPRPAVARNPRSRSLPLGRALERWRRRLRRPGERVRLPAVRQRAPRRAPRRVSRRLALRIGRVAEERCPYCLDLVRPGDPRGIRRCEICHTAHHADCWAQTGTCQVLHHNG
jgi:hypothetical protein